MTYDDALGPVPPRPRRNRPQLPPPLEIEPGPAIDEAHGLHDRFVIQGKGWMDSVDPDGALSRYKARKAAWAEGGGPRPILQVSHRSPGAGWLKLTVDDSSLLRGSVTVEKRRGGPAGRSRVTSELRFNASRFFRYHGLRLFRSEVTDGAEWLWPTGRATGKTRSYDGNDNWVELLPEAVVAWKHGLARYIREAVDAVENELREYLAPMGSPVEVRLFGLEKVIAQAEVYWEFRADDAIEGARYWGQAAHANTSHDVEKTAYENNAVSYRVRLSKKPPFALSIYAKTPDRVRFEVQYEGRISRAAPYRGEEDLVQRLLLIRSDACNRLKKVLVPIARDRSASVGARDAMTDFLANISAACAGSRMDQSALLNLLISARRLVKPVAGVPDSVLDALVRRDVIQLRSRTRTQPHEHYVVVSRYQWVLARLDQAFPAYNKQRWTGTFTPAAAR